MSKKNKILILGTVPPPIGGVTIHVSRLLRKLTQQSSVLFLFKPLNIKALVVFPFILLRYDKIHLHSSNPYVRLFTSIICFLLSRVSIITFHGDIGRYKSLFLNALDKITIRFSTIPIVLNHKSLEIAMQINSKTLLISSFIPPDNAGDGLSTNQVLTIKLVKENTDKLYCTNAYNLTYDSSDNEIYGIFEIIEFFLSHKNLGLIFSDPSGIYTNEFKKRAIKLTDNIVVLNGHHSFYEVIKLSDVSIRNTSTDGDSISVKESLFLGKITMCTDVVSRPRGVSLYKRGQLPKAIEQVTNNKFIAPNVSIEEASERLFELYNL